MGDGGDTLKKHTPWVSNDVDPGQCTSAPTKHQHHDQIVNAAKGGGLRGKNCTIFSPHWIAFLKAT